MYGVECSRRYRYKIPQGGVAEGLMRMPWPLDCERIMRRQQALLAVCLIPMQGYCCYDARFPAADALTC